MEDKSSNIKERILQIAEYKGISKEKFFQALGMTYGNFKGKSKETPINSNAIADITAMYPEVSVNWLVTGRGSMLRDPNEDTTPPWQIGMASITKPDKHSYLNPLYEGIPYYGDVDVTAGPEELFTDGYQEPSGYISIPHFEDCDRAFPLWGDSMAPLYQSGQVVLCKEYTAWRDYLPYGEVFLVVTNSLRTVKYVKKASANDKYLLVSENPHFEPFEVPKHQILRMFIVKGAIKRNMI